ncbi:FecCD family ABC transporter permease [Hominifimenecus sp. rT4P-3]|uniref:FecCD family ABC transporter permease n=1 Tax=Hominifimenecus sp. rT4P-3 TaxID=3242979 RepID=UPI003DA28E19
MDIKKGIFRGKPAYWIAILVLAAGLVFSLAVAVTIGSVDLKIGEVYRVIFYKLFGWGDPAIYGKGSLSDIVWFVRLPRLILSAGVGCALALSGVVMQAIVKNPLADPYVLGISSGASLGATLAIILGVGSFLGGGFVGMMAFLGAFGVSISVIFLANIGGRATSVKLILSGTAMSAICGAVSNFVLYVVNTSSGAMEAVLRWTMGSMAGASWDTNLWMLATAFGGMLFFWTQFRTLNLMLLGDESAVTLGTDLHRWRVLYLIVASLMVGFAVYTAGVIGFVGLIVPHVARIFFGTDHKKLIPIAALLGAIFLLWMDVLCRVLLERKELPIGILTAMVGAPIFIYLMARKKYGFGGKD